MFGVYEQASAERTNVAMGFVLLVTSALVLAVGLATYSWSASVTGAVAFVVAFGVGHRYRRRRGSAMIRITTRLARRREHRSK